MADTDTLAQSILSTLTTGVDFSTPPIDLTDDAYVLPDLSLFDAAVNRVEISAVTSGVPGSGAVFDHMMSSIREHMAEEFRAGRISGSDMGKIYATVIPQIMGQSVQFIMSRENAYWASVAAQQQASAARVAAVQARVALQTAKVDLQMQVAEKETRAANYALTVQRLAIEEAQYDLLLAQKSGAEAATAQTQYQTSAIMPQQLTNLQKEALQTEAQTSQIAYQTSTIMPAQKKILDAEYDVNLAKERGLTAEADKAVYELQSILPLQAEVLTRDSNIKLYQFTDVLPSQVASTTADTAGKVYNNTYILPEQLAALKETTEANRAKTLDTRTDGATVKGAIGVQKDLQKQQITSYIRDSEMKFMKMGLDAWSVVSTVTETPTPVDALTNPNLTSMVATIRSNLDL